jgi:hypothetical protein
MHRLGLRERTRVRRRTAETLYARYPSSTVVGHPGISRNVL